MKPASYDPGLTTQYTGRIQRSINADGSFNVTRRGERLLESGLYLHLLNMSWRRFFAVIVCGYLLVNTFFATLYYLNGPENLGAAAAGLQGYWSAFFFSVHTLTTVGYGNMAPKGFVANGLSALEAFIGLMGFSIGTGLLYGRFSRPSARLLFSSRTLVAPYQNGAALMLRVANQRPNVLTDIEATVLLMTVEQGKRRYQPLKLEREKVNFLPLTWTVVHPIDESSPLLGLGPEGLRALQAEFLVLIRCFDDTFSQTVHARHSYPFEEVEWGAKFLPAFDVRGDGNLELHLDRVHAYERAETKSVG